MCWYFSSWQLSIWSPPYETTFSINTKLTKEIFVLAERRKYVLVRSFTDLWKTQIISWDFHGIILTVLYSLFKTRKNTEHTNHFYEVQKTQFAIKTWLQQMQTVKFWQNTAALQSWKCRSKTQCKIVLKVLKLWQM